MKKNSPLKKKSQKTANRKKEKLAIVGSGIAGMGCSYFLRDQYDITVFEKADYVGGHTNTVFIPEEDKKIPIDTGFIVFNHVTYPNLKRFFEELHVPTKKPVCLLVCNMFRTIWSFAVQA